MRFRLLFFIVAGALLAGCSTFNQTEMAQIQARGVPPPVLENLHRNRSLTPEEVITLSNHRVPDAYLLRYLHANGVNYVVTPGDMKAMRQAGVSTAVRDALYAESRDFAGLYTSPPRRFRYGMSINDPYIDYPDYYGFEW